MGGMDCCEAACSREPGRPWDLKTRRSDSTWRPSASRHGRTRLGPTNRKWSPPLLPAMSDNEEIGDEQKLQIAQRLIKSSPPGQARLVTAGAGPQLGLPSSSLTQAPARRLHRRRQDRALAYSDRGCGQERDRAAQHRTLHAGGGRWRRSLGARWMRRASGQPRPARPGERACRASPSIGRAADAGERRQPRGRHAFHRHT